MTNLKNIFIETQPFRFIGKSIRNLFFPSIIKEIKPSELYIETISICNAKCLFCNYQFDYRGKYKMTIEIFTKLILSAKNIGYKRLNLTPLNGELFLHPNAIDFIEIANENGFNQIETYTNAIVLYKIDIDKLLDSGMTSLKISFPGFTKKSYIDIFGVDKYDDFKESIIKLLSIHKKSNSNMKIVFEPRSSHTLDEIYNSQFFKETISQYISENVYFLKPVVRYDTWGGEIKQSDLEKVNLKIEINPIKSIPFLKKPYLCSRLLEFGILSNGDIRMCNCRYNETLKNSQDELFVDNINNYNSYEELIIKNKTKINNFREEFKNGSIPNICQKCTFYMPVLVEK